MPVRKFLYYRLSGARLGLWCVVCGVWCMGYAVWEFQKDSTPSFPCPSSFGITEVVQLAVQSCEFVSTETRKEAITHRLSTLYAAAECERAVCPAMLVARADYKPVQRYQRKWCSLRHADSLSPPTA
ncbi:hypothetical protein M427DRAFT_300107 [Gonapodya prolifera JEL478]|uniref:Uncharacterized protein n=1 Tax=Gonapodya prolifera (strain JEL478) TaxID=1344416 RepID=A0A139AH50_GONPJ|nr:hypothetical protein M427DRAFT_240865 [Gonapodya prolifera JEL478]KXS16068.1 hypothetical protein M427DRAFT_300107 [Gonapodya prolifera JEL478]|eukprot:KXS09231.1 hypothetical protein M427DRAFT_240865 [Gonapodya prolifera JEL478]